MEKIRREKMQVREKVGKSRNTVFFQCLVAPEGQEVGSVKRPEPAGQIKDEKLHALWREAHLEVKSGKAHRSRNTFGS